MQNTKYDYSSVHIDVPAPLADEIVAWGRENITDEEIFVSQQDPTFGRENEIHVTILYGLHSESSDQVKELLVAEKPIKVRLGVTQVFSNPLKFDVVVVRAISHDLRRLNRKLAANVEYTNRYGEYNPHVTVAYVKKGKGWQHGRHDQWRHREFICESVVFSSKNGTKDRIFLGQ